MHLNARGSTTAVNATPARVIAWAVSRKKIANALSNKQLNRRRIKHASLIHGTGNAAETPFAQH